MYKKVHCIIGGIVGTSIHPVLTFQPYSALFLQPLVHCWSYVALSLTSGANIGTQKGKIFPITLGHWTDLVFAHDSKG